MNNELLNSCIDNFTGFLNQNFELVVKSYEVHKVEIEKNKYFLVSFDEFFDDWAQANWELLVERVVCSSNESFPIYGSGSDYEAAAHSRVFFHEIAPTHQIVCNSACAIDWISKKEIDLSQFDFESFVSRFEGWFDVIPPFDHVLFCEKGAVGGNYLQVVIPREQLNFCA
ncbi:MAG: hypothetical protein ACJAVU_003413 [Cognaticolwellia sp.]|jgi:hypothetical protein